MNACLRNGFTGEELRQDYLTWTRLSEERRPHLSSDERAWLAAWEQWDLACSPMIDDHRRLIRYGHCLGWSDSKQANGHATR